GNRDQDRVGRLDEAGAIQVRAEPAAESRNDGSTPRPGRVRQGPPRCSAAALPHRMLRSFAWRGPFEPLPNVGRRPRARSRPVPARGPAPPAPPLVGRRLRRGPVPLFELRTPAPPPPRRLVPVPRPARPARFFFYPGRPPRAPAVVRV